MGVSGWFGNGGLVHVISGVRVDWGMRWLVMSGNITEGGAILLSVSEV